MSVVNRNKESELIARQAIVRIGKLVGVSIDSDVVGGSIWSPENVNRVVKAVEKGVQSK